MHSAPPPAPAVSCHVIKEGVADSRAGPPATGPVVTGQRRASDSRAFYSQQTPKPPPPTSAKIDAAASIERARPKPSLFDPPSPVSDLNPRRVPPPTPPFHFLIRPFDVEALTNVHPAASDPQISTAPAASLNAPKVRTSFMVSWEVLSCTSSMESADACHTFFCIELQLDRDLVNFTCSSSMECGEL